MPIDVGSVFSFIDLVGVFVGALGGALYARARGFDATGMLWIAVVGGVGGGLARDTLVQAGPPLPLVNIRYLIMVLAGAAVAFLLGRTMERVGPGVDRTLLTLDALALGSFAAAGVFRTLDVGLSYLPALFIGVVGATAGAILRDVLCNDVPFLFLPGRWYTVVAILTSAAVVACEAASVPRPVATLVSIVLGFGLRMLSLRFGWNAPMPR